MGEAPAPMELPGGIRAREEVLINSPGQLGGRHLWLGCEENGYSAVILGHA